jgi:hypothetical protein
MIPNPRHLKYFTMMRALTAKYIARPRGAFTPWARCGKARAHREKKSLFLFLLQQRFNLRLDIFRRFFGGLGAGED